MSRWVRRPASSAELRLHIDTNLGKGLTNANQDPMPSDIQHTRTESAPSVKRQGVTHRAADRPVGP